MQRNRAHRFCPGCGAQFADGAYAADGDAADAGVAPRSRAHAAQLQRVHERKHVTVLFADLCGSTEQISRIDPEEAQIFLDRALQLMAQAVEAYGGTVTQLLGDGVLALFGAPIAQEDHALRGCLAAIEMQRRARDPGVDGRPLLLRVGINSGEVIVGADSPLLTSHYRADGSTIHLAARLEQLARPGTALLSGATLRLTGEQVETYSLGPRSIRGIAGEVEVYELVTSDQRSAAAPLARRRRLSAMVGRDAALGELRRVAQQVFSGHRRALGLRGEAGIGKSRLLSEFSESLRQEGCEVHCIAAHAYASHVSYGVASKLVLELVGVPLDVSPNQQRNSARAIVMGWTADAQAHIAAAVDMLDLGDPDPEWVALTPTQRRRRIGDLVYWLITRRLASGPLVLVIEDIFLADRDSERLIEMLARRLENMPVLLCFTYRPDFNRRWMDASWFVEHKVGPLGYSHMVSVARELLGPDDSLNDVLATLVERADGNPFFLEQLAMTLVDNGTLVGPPRAYVLSGHATEVGIPESITAVISARVDRLPAAAKASLESAAILGEPATAELIAKIRRISNEQATSHLQLALASGLLAAPAQNELIRWRFRHSLVQEIVAGALTRPRRKDLHRSAFLALREHYADQSVDRSALLAHHAHQGEVWADAAGLALKSMSRSIARSANRDALRMFELGIDAARRLDPDPAALPLELGLCLETLGALLPLGKTAAIVANLERAEEITKLLGDSRRQAAVSLQLAVILWTQGSYDLGLDAAANAAGAAEAAGSRSMQMAARQAHMMLNHGVGKYREVVEEARAVIDTFGDELSVLQIMHGWAVIAATNVKIFLADSLWRMAKLEEAQSVCDEAYLELSHQEHAFSRALVDFVQGEIWTAQGRYADAAALFKSGLSACEINDMPTMSPVFLASMCGAMARAGRAHQAIAMLEKATADRMQLEGGRYNDYYFPLNLAIAQAQAGQYPAALESANAALAAASAYGQCGHQTEALFELAEIEVGAGRPDLALAHYREAAVSAKKCSMHLIEGRASERIEQASASMRLFESLKQRDGEVGLRGG